MYVRKNRVTAVENNRIGQKIIAKFGLEDMRVTILKNKKITRE